MARLVRCPRRKTFRPRADYAAAAAVVLTGGATANTTCELAGDTAYTFGEMPAEISRQRQSDHRPRPKKTGASACPSRESRTASARSVPDRIALLVGDVPMIGAGDLDVGHGLGAANLGGEVADDGELL